MLSAPWVLTGSEALSEDNLGFGDFVYVHEKELCVQFQPCLQSCCEKVECIHNSSDGYRP